MRILITGQVFYPDNFRINDIVKELAKDHEVLMVTGLPDYDQGTIPKEYRFFKKRIEKFHNADVVRVPIISRRKGAFFRSLNYISFALTGSIYTFFLRREFDVVFSFQTSPITMFLPGLVYAKKHKIRSVLYTLDLWPESVKAMSIGEESKLFYIIKKMSRAIYHGADVVLTSSPSFVDYLEETIGLSKEKIDYLPQYTDEEPVSITTKDVKNRDQIVFTFAGNIGYIQDLETIIKAADLIRDESFVIWIVGSGSNESECKALVKQFDLEAKVLFLGRKNHEEMNRIYQETDVCLLTLKNEGFIGKTIPGKFQTYLAQGKPIAGAISNESKDLINNNRLGFCVDSSDFKGLADIMREYIEKPGIIDEHSYCAFNFFNENYTRAIFMRRLKTYLEGDRLNV